MTKRPYTPPTSNPLSRPAFRPNRIAAPTRLGEPIKATTPAKAQVVNGHYLSSSGLSVKLGDMVVHHLANAYAAALNRGDTETAHHLGQEIGRRHV